MLFAVYCVPFGGLVELIGLKILGGEDEFLLDFCWMRHLVWESIWM
jgi:hypothetical protein